MSLEKTPQPEDIEKQLAKESGNLKRVANTVDSNLDKVEASSQDRMDKISDFIERNWITLMGTSMVTGGAWGLGANMISGNWERIAIGLGLGLGASKILDRVVHRIMKQARKADDYEDYKGFR